MSSVETLPGDVVESFVCFVFQSSQLLIRWHLGLWLGVETVKKTLSLKFIVVSSYFLSRFSIKIADKSNDLRKERKVKKNSEFEKLTSRIFELNNAILNREVIIYIYIWSKFEIIRYYYNRERWYKWSEFELWERINNICNKEKCDDFINNVSDFLPFFLLYFHFDIRDYRQF